ncbi:7818_t:CDS:2 [Ambispora leptoticha]|uniref:7818_t:CDS:1 n=1 Tax=Ambispora leptoticha TaxID=144679 RepID=A0A9N9EKR5_9GLOM|nr:7818_t:CDS:2 [Ambispora leptoticha]
MASSPIKRIFDARPMDECVPLPNKGQQNLRSGIPGVAATTEESKPLDEILNTDEVQIPSERINKEQENLNLAELKSFSQDLVRQKSKEGDPPHHKSVAASAESALFKYATAIAQERLVNPPDLTRDLPYIPNVDPHRLLARLKEELKQRQIVEMKTLEKQPPSGIASHVQSAVNKLEQVLHDL